MLSRKKLRMLTFFVLGTVLPCSALAEGGNSGARGAILGLGATVDALAVGAQGYELLSGDKNLAISGMTLVASIPVAATAAIFVEEDPSDALAWAVTVCALALLTKTSIDVLSANKVTDQVPKRDVGGPHITLVPMPSSREAGVTHGLSLSA